MMVEDAPESRSPIKDLSPYFPVFSEFKDASKRNAIENGEFISLSEMTSLKTFITSLAGHVASTAARLN